MCVWVCVVLFWFFFLAHADRCAFRQSRRCTVIFLSFLFFFSFSFRQLFTSLETTGRVFSGGCAEGPYRENFEPPSHVNGAFQAKIKLNCPCDEFTPSSIFSRNCVPSAAWLKTVLFHDLNHSRSDFWNLIYWLSVCLCCVSVLSFILFLFSLIMSGQQYLQTKETKSKQIRNPITSDWNDFLLQSFQYYEAISSSLFHPLLINQDVIFGIIQPFFVFFFAVLRRLKHGSTCPSCHCAVFKDTLWRTLWCADK